MAEAPAPPPIPRPLYRTERIEPVRASALFGKTLSLWISLLPKLLAIAALVHVPRYALRVYFLNRSASPVVASLQQAFAAVELLLVPAFVSVFGIYFVFQKLRDERADLGRSVAIGFRRIGTALGITAVLGAPLFIVVFYVASITLQIQTRSRSNPMPSLGLFFLVVLVTCFLMIAISLVFHVALPAAIVERIGMFKALARSARLTSGRRWTILGASLLLGLVTGLVTGILVGGAHLMKDRFTQLTFECVVQWFIGSLACVFPIVLYHELRRTKEGFGIDELAKAFD